jgi:hypothetical protein
MNRRIFFLGLIASSYADAAKADMWSLATEEEFQRENSASLAPKPATPSQPDAPIITVDQPDASNPVKSPVSIRISFHPQGSAAINVKSLRITYGFFGIDVTNRIVEHAQLTASGLSADNAQLPAGHHTVTVEISDSLNRTGIRTFDFTVL